MSARPTNTGTPRYRLRKPSTHRPYPPPHILSVAPRPDAIVQHWLMPGAYSHDKWDRGPRLLEQTQLVIGHQLKDQSMEVFDTKFTHSKLWYLFQCLLATVSVLLILVILDAKRNTAIIAALGASCFIVFTMPHAKISSSRFLLGGYLVGLAAGTFCYFLSQLDWPAPLYRFSQIGTRMN